jgi:hypothetical protein
MITFQHWTTLGKMLRRTLLSLISAVVLSLLSPLGSYAIDKLCANYLYPLPTMDGELDSDSGWIRSNELTFNNGLPQQYGYGRIRMGKDSSNLYLSVRVNQDPEFNVEDVIILMFGPTGTSGTFQKIAIYPVDAAGAAMAVPGDPPKDVQYWDASTGGTSIFWTSKNPPAWLRDAQGNFINIKVMASSTAVSDKWYQLEMRFPIAQNPSDGLVIPANADFRMYVNTIRWQPDPGNPGGYISPEVYWPQTASFTTGDVNNTPPPNEWGLASLAGPCSGVHVTRAYTNNPDTNSVNVNSTNNIATVEITNSGADAAGRVQAELKAARFGLPGPGLYGHVPWPGNPMTTPSGINSGQTVSVSTSPWDLTTDPNRTNYISSPGLCSKVELTAVSGANTLISDRYYYWNMHFSTASKFTHTAVLDATGYRKRRDGSTQQQFILTVSKADDLALDDATRAKIAKEAPRLASGQAEPARRVVTSLYEDARLLNAAQYIEKQARFFRQLVCGFRRTGEFIQIKGNRAEVVEPANCYGYLLAHIGPLTAWQSRPLIKDVKPLIEKRDQASRIETLQVPLDEGKSVLLTTDVEAVEPEIGCRCLDIPCYLRQLFKKSQ